MPSLRNIIFLGLGLALVITAMTACRQDESANPAVLLQVNDRVITLEDFERQFERTLPAEHALSPDALDELRRSFLRQAIDRQLVLSEAQRLGVTLNPEEVEGALADYRRDYPEGGFDEMLAEQGFTPQQWRQELATRLLMEKAIAQAVYDLVSISDEEVRSFYEENRADFDRPERVRARQIMVADEEQAHQALQRLREGASFAEVARAHSLSPDSEQGGDLGFFPAGEMPPEFDEVVFSLPKGEVSTPVKSDYGVHIFLVEERRSAQRMTFAEAAPMIRSQLLRAKRERAYQDWLQELGARAELQINWPLL